MSTERFTYERRGEDSEECRIFYTCMYVKGYLSIGESVAEAEVGREGKMRALGVGVVDDVAKTES